MISLLLTPIHSKRGATNRSFSCIIVCDPNLYVDKISSPCGSASTSASTGILHVIFVSDKIHTKSQFSACLLGSSSENDDTSWRVARSGYPLPCQATVNVVHLGGRT